MNFVFFPVYFHALLQGVLWSRVHAVVVSQKAVRDDRTGQMTLELWCGPFSDPPRCTVQWTTPVGTNVSSTKYGDGHYKLILGDLEQGTYTCRISDGSPSDCLSEASANPKESSFTVDMVEARFYLLEEDNKLLTQELQRLNQMMQHVNDTQNSLDQALQDVNSTQHELNNRLDNALQDVNTLHLQDIQRLDQALQDINSTQHEENKRLNKALQTVNNTQSKEIQRLDESLLDANNNQNTQIQRLDQALQNVNIPQLQEIQHLDESLQKVNTTQMKESQRLEQALHNANEARNRDTQRLEQALGTAIEAQNQENQRLEQALQNANDAQNRENKRLEQDLQNSKVSQTRENKRLEQTLQNASESQTREKQRLEQALKNASDFQNQENQRLEQALKNANEDQNREKNRMVLMIGIVKETCSMDVHGLKTTLQQITERQNATNLQFEDRLRLLEDEVEYQAAFHATSLTSQYLKPDTPIQFEVVRYNYNDYYNPTTGYFIAPYNGTYIFLAKTGTRYDNSYEFHYLMVDDLQMDIGYTSNPPGGHESDQSPVHCVIHLCAGQKVWISSGKLTFSYDGTFSSFSGFLLHRDSYC